MTSTADDQVVYTGMIMNKHVLVYGGTLWQDRASLSRILVPQKQDSKEVEFLGGTSRQCLDETLRHQTEPTVGVLRTEPVVEWQPKLTRASTAPRKEMCHSGEPVPSGLSQNGLTGERRHLLVAMRVLENDGLRERRETVEGTQSGREETGSKKMK